MRLEQVEPVRIGIILRRRLDFIGRNLTGMQHI